ECGGAHAGPDLDALHGVDAHQRGGQVAVELAVDRGAEPGRHAFGDHLDDGAYRRALLAHAIEVVLELLGLAGVGAEERVALDLVPVPARAIDCLGAHLDERAAHRHAGHDLARDRAGCDPHGGLACRLAAAAAVVAQAVLHVIGVVGVAGPVLVLDGG